MTLVPEYGETPVSEEDKEAFTPFARSVLGDSPTKDEVLDVEQAIQERESEHLYPAALGGDLALDELLTERFICDLHRRLYGDIWTWAGRYRESVYTIGVEPWQIANELRIGLDNSRFRWGCGHWTPQVLGIAVHAEVVRVHPFVDGNGRLTRLLADLVFLATQGNELQVYDWHAESFNKREYVKHLKGFDFHRDPTALAEYIGVRTFGD